jgi:hypothetical protein
MSGTYINKWAHIAVTLQGNIWTVYLNSKSVLNIVATKITLYDNIIISQLEIASNELVSLKMKEIAIFGHARRISEIYSDLSGFISQGDHFN